MNEDIVVPVAFMVMVVLVSVGIPFARAFARRMDRSSVGPAAPPDLVARLERMEQAIDSIAIEVERISEGQRFTTKLLSERAGSEAARAGLPRRESGT